MVNIYTRLTIGKQTVLLKNATDEKIEYVKGLLLSGIPVVLIEEELIKLSGFVDGIKA